MNKNGALPAELPSAGDLVRRYGVRAKRSLGQHFLTDPSILRRLVDAAATAPGDWVLEIGPGPGGLTRTLLERGCQVVAVELDDYAVAHLREALPGDRLEVVRGDVLDLDLETVIAEPFVAMGNLPYNAATEIFFKLDKIPTADRLVFMFQREVARRFVSSPGSKDYGPLALLSGIRWRPEIVIKLPPGAFVPPPRVHSAVVRFERRARPLVDGRLERRFRRLVRAAFQKRRKTLKNALSGVVTSGALERAGLDPGLRPERIAPAGWVSLARIVEESPDGP